MKQWVLEEARRAGVKERAIWWRLQQGYYPALRRRVVNRRVIFVTAP